MCDLLRFDVFEEKLRMAMARHATTMAASGDSIDLGDLLDQYREYADRLRSHIADTSLLLSKALSDGKTVLFEGAQGSLLDLDFGTFPYVTSSSTTAGGVCTGLGVPPSAIKETIGIVKAYTTRVGLGPFPTEMDEDFAEKVRGAGDEFGSTTGRPRRCGWLDIVGLRYASRINGFTQLGIAKLDVLDELDTLRICVGYRYAGAAVEHFPNDLEVLEACEPVYEDVPGWLSPTTGARTYEELPRNAQKYIERIEELLDLPVTFISVGPERSETIQRS
jgi:adenylosuccinate synthase